MFVDRLYIRRRCFRRKYWPCSVRKKSSARFEPRTIFHNGTRCIRKSTDWCTMTSHFAVAAEAAGARLHPINSIQSCLQKESMPVPRRDGYVIKQFHIIIAFVNTCGHQWAACTQSLYGREINFGKKTADFKSFGGRSSVKKIANRATVGLSESQRDLGLSSEFTCDMKMHLHSAAFMIHPIETERLTSP